LGRRIVERADVPDATDAGKSTGFLPQKKKIGKKKKTKITGLGTFGTPPNVLSTREAGPGGKKSLVLPEADDSSVP